MHYIYFEREADEDGVIRVEIRRYEVEYLYIVILFYNGQFIFH